LATGGGGDFTFLDTAGFSAVAEDATLDGGGGGATWVLLGLRIGGVVCCCCNCCDWFGTPVCLLGGGGGGDSTFLVSSEILSLPTFAGNLEGSNGGGSFLGPGLPDILVTDVGMLTSSKGDVDMLDKDCLEDDLGTDTQSGSSVRVNGFVGRLGLRTIGMPLAALGGATFALAG
jgi:hypothetical protein